ncbi:hypothetical protein NP233_g4484 [Leucocoprinus birnbaumii]|uniref:Uncharacterized protein n=1 Tax=Leucocoprinus birnbaumii TaxID=56174 RepID=A0AAD5VV88_9AGAR|nr:hypothetical protein NP233_g4484 [Leucocoprinus birnbaumii]
MSSRGGSFETSLPDVEPDFPHAWTFSAQRYVPRPRPVARIILPSHQRVRESAQRESYLPAVPFPRSQSLEPLLRHPRESGDITPLAQDGRIQWWLYNICQRIGNSFEFVKRKAVRSIVAAWLPIRRSLRLVKDYTLGILRSIKRAIQNTLRAALNDPTFSARVQV